LATFRKLDLDAQLFPKLFDYDLSHDRLVFKQHMREQVCAKPADRECREQHIGTEEYFHDTLRKMSSSVR
jgi:hypothetical protein